MPLVLLILFSFVFRAKTHCPEGSKLNGLERSMNRDDFYLLGSRPSTLILETSTTGLTVTFGATGTLRPPYTKLVVYEPAIGGITSTE